MRRPPRGAPSWVGTVIVVVAIFVIGYGAAAQLRRAVRPEAAPAGTGGP